MKKFLWEMVKFCGIQGALAFACLLVFFGIPEQHHYLASAVDKKYRLDNAESPRIILTGDSGVAYGMKSPLLAEAYPNHTVVNMGLMAGLGFRNILAEVEEELRPGDVVVMIFAHQVFDRNLLHYQYWNYATYRPDMLLRLKWRDVPILMDNSLYILKRAMKAYKRVMTWKAHPDRPGPVNRAGFNQYGDLVAHHSASTLPTNTMVMNDLTMEDLRVSRQVAREMNAFAQSAQERGATVLYMFPPIPETAWNENQDVIRQSASYVENELNFPVINQLEEMVYPDDNFYDTNYHLLEAGARRRTELLAQRIREYVVSPETAQEDSRQ